MDGVLSTLERLVFEEYLTVTPALLTTLVPSIDALNAKAILDRFAQLNSEKLETLFLITKRLSDGRTVLAKTSDVTDTSNFLCTPAVYQVRMRGSMETAVALENRVAEALLKKVADINASTEDLWRNPLAGAVSAACERRLLRALPGPSSASRSASTKPPQAPSSGPARPSRPVMTEHTGSGTAKPTTIATAFAKASTAPKRPVDEPKSASVVSVSSATIRAMDDEDEEVTMQVRNRKRQRVIDDEPEQKQAPSVSQEPSAIVSAETVKPPVFEELSEYKIKKKVTVTEISLSEKGYMEVEDVQQMQEEIIKKPDLPRVPLTQQSRLPMKPAPAGQRTLMDMFKKK
jgi:hypothetical protein